jgi:hypothetical protein
MQTVPMGELRRILSYDPNTGLLCWLIQRGNLVSGEEAGCVYLDGYVYVKVYKHLMLAHRIAWALYTGKWPRRPLDHINMIRSDNRIINLRLASVAENNRNRAKQSNNTSGYKGVTFNKASGKYQAKIMHNKKTVCLGYFYHPAQASVAYQKAVKEFHDEFARF